jgi:AbrB family looped-hinge helix DNA binding protein
MREILSTISSKGQVTIPSEVRKRLGVKQGDKLSFVIEDEQAEGEVRILISAPRYSGVSALRGAAGSLKEPRSWEEMLQIAHEDRAGEITGTE